MVPWQVDGENWLLFNTVNEDLKSSSGQVQHLFQATAHADKLFRLIDLNGDGKLSEQEFIKVIEMLNIAWGCSTNTFVTD